MDQGGEIVETRNKIDCDRGRGQEATERMCLVVSESVDDENEGDGERMIGSSSKFLLSRQNQQKQIVILPLFGKECKWDN